jgi:hypothetical protein
MRWFVTLVLLGFLLVACDQTSTPKPPATGQPQAGATTTGAPAAGPTATGAYPAPAGAYPAPAAALDSNGYPAPTLPQGPEFSFTLPVKASDAEVTGKGPAGVPIKLVNVARSAETIGETTIGSDGTFKISAQGKLIAGDRIALMLGNLAGTKFNQNDFLSGPGYQDYPLVGILFTSAVVQ